MSSKISSLFSAISSLAAVVAFGSPCVDPAPVVGHTIRSPDSIGESKRITIGSNHTLVLDVLGEPDVRLNEEFWIYWNCRVTPASANPQGFDSLIVIFNEGRVIALKASDGESIRRGLR
jgi:hypothetical protein